MKKGLYKRAADVINETLGVTDFEVVDTKGVHDGYCDDWSIRVSDDSWDLYWNANTIDKIDDVLVSKLGVYIEPYNRRLLNICKL